MSRKTCISVYVEPATYMALKRITATTHVAGAELIRQALDEWFSRQPLEQRPVEVANG